VGDEEFPIFDQAGFVGSFVNPVKSRTFFVIEVAGDGFVGKEHELFDQLVGFVGRLFFDPVGFSLGIKEDTKLGKIEVEGALGKALLAKGGGKVPSALEKAIEIVLGGASESEKGFGIGEAVPGVDDGSGETGGTRFAFGIEANEGGVGETLFVGAEGAEAVRKAGRKHGNDAVDKIHAVGPFAGLVIQFGSGFDVV
jgi:hypothetical protein